MMPTMKVQYLLKQWNDSGNELVITRNAYWQTKYIRTRDNRNFCKLHGIRLSGPKLGRPSLTKQSSKEKKQEYQDNTDRIEVERSFRLSKRCYGMDLIRTKLYDTTLTSIALSVFVTNLFKIQSRILFALIYLLELIGLQPADFEPETV